MPNYYGHWSDKRGWVETEKPEKGVIREIISRRQEIRYDVQIFNMRSKYVSGIANKDVWTADSSGGGLRST